MGILAFFFFVGGEGWRQLIVFPKRVSNENAKPFPPIDSQVIILLSLPFDSPDPLFSNLGLFFCLFFHVDHPDHFLSFSGLTLS